MTKRRWVTMGREPIEDFAQMIATEVAELESPEIHIGTDAQKHGRFVEFSICVGILKPLCSRGGHRVIYDHQKFKKEQVGDLWTKLSTECLFSIEVAEEILDSVDNVLKENITIHLDVNTDERFASNKYESSLVGMARGYGYKVITKPDAWLASHAADHCVKHKNK